MPAPTRSPLAAMREAWTSPYGSPEVSRGSDETHPFLAPASPRIGTVGVTVSARAIRNRIVLTLALVVALGSAGTLYHEDAKEAVVAAWRVARPATSSSSVVHLPPDPNPESLDTPVLWPLHRPTAMPATAAAAPAPSAVDDRLESELASHADGETDGSTPRPGDEALDEAEAVSPTLGPALATSSVGVTSSAGDLAASTTSLPASSPSSDPLSSSSVLSVSSASSTLLVSSSTAPVPSASPPRVIIKDGFLDTNPPLPSLIPATSAREKYLAFVPHSGFHNQRINLQGAMALAYMLNRTLLVPPCRLGWPQPWKTSSVLQAYVDRQQKMDLWAKCIPQIPALEAGKRFEGALSACNMYTRYTEVGWDLLFRIDRMQTPIRLVERPNLRREWLFSPTGLGINPKKAYRFVDKTRYHWRIYDSKADDTPLGRYAERLDAEDLKTGKWADYELLEFNSIYGSGRTSRTLPGSIKAWNDARDAMTLRFPLIDDIADVMERQVGGRGHFYSAHLRVGDSHFKEDAARNMQRVFRELCKVLGVPPAMVSQLIAESTEAQHRARLARADIVPDSPLSLPWSSMEGEDGEDEMDDDDDEDRDADDADHDAVELPTRARLRTRATLPLSSEAKSCRRPRYTDPDRLVLNKRIYVATDSRHPLTDPALAPFVHSFPCVFFLGDFTKSVPALSELTTVRSAQEKIKLGSFLIPLLEAVMAARGARVFGTPGSTFSGYAKSSLHDLYWPKTASRAIATA